VDLPVSLLTAEGQVVVFVLAALGLFVALLRAPWRRLADGTQLNLLLGFAVGLMLLWSMKAGVKPGLNLHLLGAMAATLALGPWLAVLALALALCGITLNGSIEWGDWPSNLVLIGACCRSRSRALSGIWSSVGCRPISSFLFLSPASLVPH